MNYKIDELKITKQSLIEGKYRYIYYEAFLCKISIASDDWGTQICFNGAFFDKMDFKNLEEGVEYLREHKKEAIKFFRKVYLHSFKYKFSYRYMKHLYWVVRHYFNPNYYFGGK